MELLELNLKAIIERKGGDFSQFLAENNVKKVNDLKLSDIELFCAREDIQLDNLLLYNHNIDRSRLKNIKFIILDVDGVMTDGGMNYTQKGDEIKNYNTKDGRGILEAGKLGVQFGIISSGHTMELIKRRADVLKIDNFYVGKEPKLKVLDMWCERMDIKLSEMAIIGDDLNDLEVMKHVGFSAAPADAVPVIKKQADLILQKRGGEGCVREFIDYYLLDKPLTK